MGILLAANVGYLCSKERFSQKQTLQCVPRMRVDEPFACTFSYAYEKRSPHARV